MGSDMGTKIMTNTDQTIDTGEHGQQLPKMLPDPGAPSKQEVLEHQLTHIPFRLWCPHCVAGRRVSGHHVTVAGKEKMGVTISLD